MPTIAGQIDTISLGVDRLLVKISGEHARQTSANLYIDSALSDISDLIDNILDEMQAPGAADDFIDTIDVLMSINDILEYTQAEQLTQDSVDANISGEALDTRDDAQELASLISGGVTFNEKTSAMEASAVASQAVYANDIRYQAHIDSISGQDAVLSGLLDDIETMLSLQPLSVDNDYTAQLTDMASNITIIQAVNAQRSANIADAVADQNADISTTISVLNGLQGIGFISSITATVTTSVNVGINVILNIPDDEEEEEEDPVEEALDLVDINLNTIDMTELFSIDPNISLKLQRSLAMLQRESLIKRKTQLEALPDSDTVTAWCADLTTDLSAGDIVGTIENNDEYGQSLINIRPAYEGRADYDGARDGQITSLITGTAAHTFYNLAMQPALQKWIPHYRIGAISNIDTGANTASVTLDSAASSQQSIDINQAATLTGIPVEYMQCNASAFENGDRVIVEFTQGEAGSGTWDTAKVVGFESEPRGCGVPIIMVQDRSSGVCVLWNYKTNSAPDGMDYVFGNATAAGAALAAAYGAGLYPDELVCSGSIPACIRDTYDNSEYYSSTRDDCEGIEALGTVSTTSLSYAYDSSIYGDGVQKAVDVVKHCPISLPVCTIGEFREEWDPGCYEWDGNSWEYSYEASWTLSFTPEWSCSFSRPRDGYFIHPPNNNEDVKYIYSIVSESGYRNREKYKTQNGDEYLLSADYYIENRQGTNSIISNIDNIPTSWGSSWDYNNSYSIEVHAIGGGGTIATGTSILNDIINFYPGNYMPSGIKLKSHNIGINTDNQNLVYFASSYGNDHQDIIIYAQTDATPINPADPSAGYQFDFDACAKLDNSAISANLSGSGEVKVYMIKRA